MKIPGIPDLADINLTELSNDLKAIRRAVEDLPKVRAALEELVALEKSR
jgi:hypothetical protein